MDFNLLDYAAAKWPELTTALGIGGAGALGTNKLMDKQQNARLKKLEDGHLKLTDMVAESKGELSTLKSDLEKNREMDIVVREEIKQNREDFKSELKEIKESVNLVLKHLLSSK